MDIRQLDSFNLISLYGKILQELKDRKVIRTKNLIGEIGEYLVLDFYNNAKGCPKLQAAPLSTKNIDAISKDGNRYSIKCTTTNTTGVFYGLPKDRSEIVKPFFEYVIIIVLNSTYGIKQIIELDWDTFIKYKRWHSRMNAWNLIVTNKLIADSKIIFKS